MSIEVFKMDSQLVRVGEIQDSGRIINNAGVIHGLMRSDGLLLKQDGSLLGRVHNNGEITTSDSDLHELRLDPMGNIFKGSELIGRLQTSWNSLISQEKAVYAAWTLLA